MEGVDVVSGWPSDMSWWKERKVEEALGRDYPEDAERVACRPLPGGGFGRSAGPLTAADLEAVEKFREWLGKTPEERKLDAEYENLAEESAVIAEESFAAQVEAVFGSKVPEVVTVTAVHGGAGQCEGEVVSEGVEEALLNAVEEQLRGLQRVEFDGTKLWADLNAARIARGVTWLVVAREVGVVMSTFTRMKKGPAPTAGAVLRMMLWASRPDVTRYVKRRGV